jgi:arabinose-5-phosphate isomerase
MVNQEGGPAAAGIVERGAKVIRDEAAVLEGLASSLGDPFAESVHLLLGCKGKVVLSGIGKSGRIAEKVAASMSSLGLPAVFLHSTEALHGDIGLVQPNDVVFVISNSGTTKEVLDIIPTLRAMGVPIISISMSAQTPLALATDVALVVAAGREADVLNLAPTSSTTGLLALGDALAVVVSEMKGFTTADYGFRHPAGALGKKTLGAAAK